MILNIHESEFNELWDLLPATWVINAWDAQPIDEELTVLEVDGGQRKDDYSHTGRAITWEVVDSESHVSGGVILTLGGKRRFVGNDEVAA